MSPCRDGTPPMDRVPGRVQWCCCQTHIMTDSQTFVVIKRGSFLYRGHRKFLIDMPTLLIGFHKHGPGHHLNDGVGVATAGVKCSLTLSQTGSVGELSKTHHQALITTIEFDSVAVVLTQRLTHFLNSYSMTRHMI